MTMNLIFFQIFAFMNLYNIIQLKASRAVSFSRQDKYLTNHVLRFLEQQDWLDCTLACEQDPECISYNYHRHRRICELNDHGVEKICGNTESELVSVEGWLYHQLKPVTKTANKQGLPNPCDCNCGTSKQCSVEPKLGDSPENPGRSCLEILNKRSHAPSGPYYLLTTGSHPVYCHMDRIPDCGAGGWMLVMKIDGAKETFKYSSQWWTNTETYKTEHGWDLGKRETKLGTFVQHQAEKGYCVGMQVDGEIKWMLVRWTADSLFARFAATDTVLDQLDHNKWRNLLANSSIQLDEVKLGFNMKSGALYGARARLGMIGSKGGVYGSRLGFGTSGSDGGADDSNSCGNEASGDSDMGARSVKAFCFIMVQ